MQAAESVQQHRRRLRRRRLNAQRRNAGAHGPSRARVPVFECGTVWSPLAEGPFFNGTLVPRIQLAILTTSKSMSWPRLARPRDLVDSLVWRGDDRATEFFLSLPFGWAPLCERVPMLRMPDPIHPDLPCLFAGAIVPALCSVVIPDACGAEPLSNSRARGAHR